MTTLMALVLFIVVVALIFDFANGWHDAANSIATVVSTRVLSPGIAVLWAAVFNFVAFLVYGTREPGDTTYYPELGKVSLRGLGVTLEVPGICRPQNDSWATPS